MLSICIKPIKKFKKNVCIRNTLLCHQNDKHKTKLDSAQRAQTSAKESNLNRKWSRIQIQISRLTPRSRCLPDRSQNIVDSLHCWHQSRHQVSWKSTGDCMRNANKCHKIPYSATVRKWKSEQESVSVKWKSERSRKVSRSLYLGKAQWHSGRTLVFIRQTFPVLCSTCSWWVTMWVNCPLEVRQPGRLSLSSFWGQ